MEENSSHKEEAFLAYNATKNRLEQYYNQIGNRNNMGVLMWKEGYSWISAKVLNYGDIKEAYFDFLTIQHNTNLICSLRDLGQPPYYSHELVKYFFEDFIAKVDSGSAIAGEDVKRNGVEYAVKGQGANLPGLIQYANLANQIVIGKISSQEEIEKYLKKHQGGTRNHIENAFDKTTEKVLRNVKSMLETGKL